MSKPVDPKQVDWLIMSIDQEQAAEAGLAGDEKPGRAFADELKRRMTLAGLNSQQLADRVTKRGKVKLDKRRVEVLRSTGVPSLIAARKSDELAEISSELGCKIIDLFPGEQPIETAVDDSPEAQRMLTVALKGPKSNFLLDALELAYAAAITSRPSR